MGYQDRHYYRDTGGGPFNPLTWLLTGSVSLFTAFDIRVRAHASLLLLMVLVLIFGLGQGFSIMDRSQSMTMLFAIVLLHEFGHCFAARRVGGSADEIVMTPIGGLAMAQAPNRPLPTFITVAAGPAVNVVICIVCWMVIWLNDRYIPLNPWLFASFHGWLGWVAWTYQVSYILLLFNLLPIFPMDGGRMLQAGLWPLVGYYRSMNFACIVGMVGAVLMAIFGLAGMSVLLVAIAASGFLTCFQTRRALLAAGPFELEDSTDYSAAYETFTPKPRRHGKWAAKRALKLARQEVEERDRIDAILAKVSAHGMQSLTWLERRALKKATEHQRQRDEELSRIRGD